DLQLDVGRVVLERLQIGVGDDELDAVEAGVDHAVDRIAAASADADHLDAGARAGRLLGQPQAQPPGVARVLGVVRGVMIGHSSLLSFVGFALNTEPTEFTEQNTTQTLWAL